MKLRGLLPLWTLSCALGLTAWAQAADKSEVKAQALLSGLNNPSGLAVQPGTGDVFVSDSGALRVVKVPAKGGKAADVITGFSKDVYGKGPMYDIGPLGLLFLDQNTLVVGDGGHVDGKELLYIFDVSSSAPQKVDQARHTLGPIAPGADSAMGEGNFYALAQAAGSVFITSNGDDTAGWVLKFDVNGGKPGKLTPAIKTKVATGVDAPVGITTSRDGKLVIGQMGEVNVPGDSLLTVYDPKSGKLEMKAETGLYDIAGLAFSPKTGKLYAVDFAWMDAKQGGLFRLDIGKDKSVKAVKVLALDRPTALAFDKSGVLYVTAFGAGEAVQAEGGVLLKIPGGL